MEFDLVKGGIHHSETTQDKRLLFISITQFINVVGSAGFCLRSVFFSFVFSTKEREYSFLF